jgi:hypothetical protein
MQFIWFDLNVYFDLSFLHEHVLGIYTKKFKKSVKRTAVINDKEVATGQYTWSNKIDQNHTLTVSIAKRDHFEWC